MATQAGRGGGGRDVRDGKAETGKSQGGGRQGGRGGGGRDVVGGKAVTGKSKSASQSRSAGGTGVRGAGGYRSPTGRLAQRADVQAATKGTATNAQADAAARAWADRVSDYNNTYNSGWDNVGNFAASLMGFNEMNPSFDPSLQNTQNRANWGFDPAGAIGGALGMGVGMPFGAGLIADQVSSYFGRPLEVNMGPDVFGGGMLSGQAPQMAGGGTGMGGGMGQQPGSQPGSQWGGGVLAPNTPAPSGWWAPQQPQFQWAQPWSSQGVLSPPTQNQWSWGSWG